MCFVMSYGGYVGVSTWVSVIAYVVGRCGHFQVWVTSQISTKSLLSAMLRRKQTYRFSSCFSVDYCLSHCRPFRYSVLCVKAIITHGDSMLDDCFGDVRTQVTDHWWSVNTALHKCTNCDFNDFCLCSSCHNECSTDPSTVLEAPMSGCHRNIKHNYRECDVTQGTCINWVSTVMQRAMLTMKQVKMPRSVVPSRTAVTISSEPYLLC